MEVETVIPHVPQVERRTSTHIRFSDDEEETSELQSKLGFCEVCAATEAKYTCPRCEVKTCSLKCSTIHKKELECTGERDRAKFIPVKKFTNLDLSSDYRLLEEITRSLASTKKLRNTFNKSDQTLPNHLFRLKKTLEKNKTTLKFLPLNFDRHRRNTTKLNFQSNVVFWHIEWVFTNADNLHLHDDLVRETEKLGKVIRKYLVKQENPLLQEKLQYYQAAGITGIKILLRAEGKRGLKFYELDPTLTLQECFRGKSIIEYPVIQVIFKDHCHDLQVIDSDDEDGTESDAKIGSSVINSIIKHSESEENIYKAMKNLLFISEHSDGEMSE